MEFDVREFIPKERHAEVFDWLCRVTGKEPKQLASEILIQAVVREYSAFREAKGGGGQSSKNLEALANRLR